MIPGRVKAGLPLKPGRLLNLKKPAETQKNISEVVIMKRFLIFSLAVAFVVAMTGLSYANHTTTSAGDAANGIIQSRHNLSTGGEHFHSGDTNMPSSRLTTTGTSEVCVFCHTPHWSSDKGPLWNRVSAQTSFSDHHGNNFEPGEGSISCLSCHDGSTALDSLINRPGHGSNTDATISSHMGWAFQDDGSFHTHVLGEHYAVGANNNLGDDHPINKDYNAALTEHGGAGVHALRPTNTALSDIDLTTSDGSDPLVTGNLWSIEGNIQEDGTIGDLLEDGNVECVSCHDPHYKNLTNPDPDFVASYGVSSHTDPDIDGLFLKRVGGNSDSGVCRTCHDK